MRKFNKKALSTTEQLELLITRGLVVEDKNSALKILQEFGYYRLSAYMRCFQSGDDHLFATGTKFTDILDLYRFDEKLRTICFEAVSKVEIAYRVAICNTMCSKYDSHWFLNKESFDWPNAVSEAKKIIKSQIKKSRNEYSETFIAKYYKKYDSPRFPPFWMCAETFTIGKLNQLYKMVSRKGRIEILSELGFLYDASLMADCNWLYVLCITRNICAHHSRLFNRVFKIQPTTRKKIIELSESDNSFYRVSQVIDYCLKTISNDVTFEENIKNLFAKFPNIDKRKIGFPPDWQGYTATRIEKHSKRFGNINAAPSTI